MDRMPIGAIAKARRRQGMRMGMAEYGVRVSAANGAIAGQLC